MSTANTNMEATFWEKLGDRLSGLSDSVGRFLLRLFGSSNERYIRKLGYTAAKKPSDTPVIAPGSYLDLVNKLEDKMHGLSDAELAALTPAFRERLKKGETLDDLLPEAFAACREAALRTKNMRHYDVQILGGVVLHRGAIAEMVTGEGKTLVATLPAYLNALAEKGVHVVTVNDYLARRDCEWMLPIYRALGLTVGYIQSEMEPAERRKAYDCDITYGTNSEFGFDYLRDNMKPARWGDPNYPPYVQQCQKELNYAIIDEVDNILIDEARTPLIISGAAFSDIRRYSKANEIAVQLTELEKKARAALKQKKTQEGDGQEQVKDTAKDKDGETEEPEVNLTEELPEEAGAKKSAGLLAGPREEKKVGIYFEIKEKEHTCHLTDEGVRKAEELAGVESFYTAGNMEWPHLIDNSLRAHHLYKKDKQYAVMRNEEGVMSIIIIDEFTGRLMHGRQWSDGLHQAVEAKHARDGVKIKEETQTLATITLQNFFKLYKKIAGMTGTAMTEANEFWKIYKLDVIAIPTNKPLIRLNSPDLVYRSEKEKWKAVLDEIVEVHESGRPMLVGTTDVDKSLKLSDMLKRRGVKHELLNALPEHAAREAEIVAQAGRIGAVTISTNMAGRGTDIILGGNPETMAWARLKGKYASRLDVPEDEWKKLVDEIEAKEKMKEEGRRVAAMGGLHIVGTERHEARRIDNQLRGRAGRQGDPGSSRFYVSLEDDLMRIFGGERVKAWLTYLGMEDGMAIESRLVSRQIQKAQKKVEERNFDIRKHLLEYDEVMDTQRKRVYSYRQEILEDANCKVRILDMIEQQIDAALGRYLDDSYGSATFAEFAANRLGVEFEAGDFKRDNYDEAVLFAFNKASRGIATQIQDMLEENLGDEDAKQWNWQALSASVNARWGLKTSDRSLKQIGKDNLAESLIAEAEKAIQEIDLAEGRHYLESDWGLVSLADWTQRKFQIELKPEELADKDEAELKKLLLDKVEELYTRKEIEFPVQAAMATFMAERAHAPGQSKYDREGLYNWARVRFPAAVDELHEEEFRTQSRSKLQERLFALSKKYYPSVRQAEIDDQLEETFAHAQHSEPEDAKELAAWAKSRLDLDVGEQLLTGVSRDKARDELWNAFDLRYRPEMRGMERSLLLQFLDTAWKNHLYAMDHLREGMRMMWVGQIDAKTEYKRQGMKEFESMWEGINDKVTDMVFRMEEAEGFQDSIWQIGATIHESAPRVTAQEQTSANTGEGKKAEPIRNRGQKVGRNDPCPCNSGKKYKNCCMRQAAK
jgi:preprotein translocase subunit SecA